MVLEGGVDNKVVMQYYFGMASSILKKNIAFVTCNSKEMPISNGLQIKYCFTS